MQELDLYAATDADDLLGRLVATSMFEILSEDEGLLFRRLPCYISGALGRPGDSLEIRRLELDVEEAITLMRENLESLIDDLWQLATAADLPLMFVAGSSEASYWSNAGLTTSSLIHSMSDTLSTGRLAAVHPLVYAAERVADGRLSRRLCELPQFFHRSQPGIGCMAWFAVLDDGGPGGVLEDPGLLHGRALEIVNG